MEQMAKISNAGGVLAEYRELFWRQPNVYDVSKSFLRDENGEWTDQWGITVWVTKKVDQSTLPPEDRIPETLRDDYFEEDVPIQIVEAEPPPKVAPSTCDYSMCRSKFTRRRDDNEHNKSEHAGA